MYDTLLDEAVGIGLIVVEFEPISAARGLIKGNKIGIRRSMKTVEKVGVLSEELGHYHTGIGDILDQRSLNGRKQELRARQWGHVRIIPFTRFLDAHYARISGRYDLASFLGVTEQFLQEAVDRYKDRHGLYVSLDNQHTLCLDPLGIIELLYPALK